MSFLMRVKSKQPAGQTTAGPSTQDLGNAFASSTDRRREARCRADRHHPAVSAELIGGVGVNVTLCDVSRHGIMFESSMRILVGAHVTIRLRTARRTLTLPGDVVRCRVSATRRGRLRYETALALRGDCPIENDELTIAPAEDEVVEVVEGEVIDAEAVELVRSANQW